MTRRLLLAARIAAGRLTAPARACGTWRPLLLRWRRRRGGVRHDRAGATALVGSSLVSQLHLHLAFRLSGRDRVRERIIGRGGVDRVHRLATERFRRTVETAGRAGAVVETSLVRRAYRDDVASVPARAPRGADGALAPARAHAPVWPAVETVARRRPAFPARTSATRRDGTDRAPTVVMRRRRGTVRPPLLATARPPLRTALVSSFDERSALAPNPRTPDLVWRAKARTGSDSGRADASARTPSSATAPASERTSRGPASTAATWERTLVTGTPPAALDRGTLDRIADDVIRRVERRVRIERERRGI